MNSLHWVPEETKQALSALRAERRHINELRADLADLREIFWHTSEPQRKAWALQMIKSIEHELRGLGEEV